MNAAIKLAAALAVPVLGLALTAVPAQAASDTNLSGLGSAGIGSVASGAAPGAQGSNSGLKTIGNQKVSPAADTSNDAMPDNPSQKLPDRVSAAVPDDATVVSKDLAVTKDGQIKNLETGKPVTDPKLVGTPDKPADPLAKTDGKRFIPVEASEVKQAVQQNGGDANAADSANNGSSTGAGASTSSSPSDIPGNGNASSEASTSGDSSSATENNASAVSRHSEPKANDTAYVGTAKAPNGSVRNAALQNNQYGAYWGSYNNTPSFFERGGKLFAQQAKGVVDVSEHQGTIDWQTAKRAGVEGAIIRISFGWGNRLDYQAQRNINECKRLGIPFGIYMYSYAYDWSSARQEGLDTVNKLKNQLHVNPGDLSYPVYYDLENWTWEGHAPPTSPAVYDDIVNNWFMAVQTNGYGNVSVYSYTYYLNTALNTGNIHSRTRWVASYGARTGFNYPTNDRGWQYADNNNIPGIGNVDANAFGNYNYVSTINLLWQVRQEDIAVGAAVNGPGNLQYKWQSYNVNTHVWTTFADWNGANWAGWAAEPGDYWLHLEVREAGNHHLVGTKTIAFRYSAGYAAITGTYAGYRSNGILLGMSSNDPRARYVVKIYDYNAKRWVSQFSGQWATWQPRRGVYWTHYELHTSDGRLADTRTYTFGV
ncbi:GH25 family lysozyme [Bifidobacterium sp. ESL0704]|uniref:GH25 family lysozyme n=1 Tax=Bifidobacterium sp. ESL0704 TaxID=2983219 RepID=UPI0023F9D93C|nr:GH25 family lysozyme [Bifidobacterium sp. ESL0704]WEV53122.1 GH25 family lysozyme [Bifidobacterium sp. ESL0704]